MRIGISARLAKTAFAQGVRRRRRCGRGGLARPRPALPRAVRLGHGRRAADRRRRCRCSARSCSPTRSRTLKLDLADYAAEWKWDGIRVQLVHVGGQTRLFSRTGDDITGSFPEVAAAYAYPAVLDGELLVRGEFQGGAAGGDDFGGGGAASFNALQQRLGRKAPTAKAQAEFPAFVRLYDVLFDGDEDLREQPWTARRTRLEAIVPRLDPARFDLSAVIAATISRRWPASAPARATRRSRG